MMCSTYVVGDESPVSPRLTGPNHKQARHFQEKVQAGQILWRDNSTTIIVCWHGFRLR